MRTIFLCAALVLVLGLVSGTTAQGASNSLTISEEAGSSTTNYPVRIARPFAQGEISQYPKAVVGGTPVTTQADVKCRWPDGSVKHAILSFLVPTLSANGSVTVTFQNQSSGNNSGYESESDMLAAGYDFDATIALTNGSTVTASARTMLDAAAFTYWTQGPVATTVIIADHTTSRAYDMGFDSHKSFRPLFVATFWPDLNKVHVRAIGEIANTEHLQDMSYDLTVKSGQSSPASVLSQSGITHYARSRWTTDFWIGGEPSEVSIDHNLAYLASTTLIPNYDTSKSIGESVIQGDYQDDWDSWLNADRDLFDAGRWQKAMGSTGGRPDIGPYPDWTVQWLYTGDWRSKAYAFGSADLAAAWPLHYREGDTTKKMDRAGTVDGLGRVMSVSDRPTFFELYLDYSYTDADDKVTPVGTYTNGGWIPERNHQPQPFYPQYLLTGDWFYLEEMYFWAAYSVARSNGAATANKWGRGPTGAEGAIYDEVRGEAWTFRSRVEVAAIAPDNSAEKAYFEQLVEDAIAAWEGMREITGTAYQNNAVYTWAKDMMDTSQGEWGGLGAPLLQQWHRGNSGLANTSELDTSVTGEAIAPWMQNFVMYALGRGRELGYATDELVEWLGWHINGILVAPDYDPFLMGAYREPTVSATTGTYFQSWAELKTGYASSMDAESVFDGTKSDAVHGYANIAIPSVAAAAHLKNGALAWDFINTECLSNTALDDNPKWAILPRSTNAATGSTNNTIPALNPWGLLVLGLLLLGAGLRNAWRFSR